VAAVLALAGGEAAAVTVSTLGCNEQAIAGRFVRERAEPGNLMQGQVRRVPG
jgi:hypothetical protein